MLSSSLFLSVGATILSLPLRISAQTYSYTLQDTYAGSSFYDHFNFYTGADPTNGFVQYVDQSTANASGLIGYGQGTAKWGVDNTTILSTTSAGRNSVRLEGNTNYNHGLFIADIKHMPGSICGVWPAFWTLGGGIWPAEGEMDIIEGVNLNSGNQITAHTSPNCTMAFTGQTGPVVGTDYDCAVVDGNGCSVGSSQANDYGSNFNANGGGVYVMQWTSAFIKVWFFPRNAIPASITAGAPDYTTFGTPQANFDGASCNIDQHFIDHRIIFDTTFCGDWAGAVYSSSSCPNTASGSNGCVDYVAATPGAFSEAYWEVNSVKVYSESVVSSSASSSSSSATSSRSSSSSSTSRSSSVSSSTLASTTSSSVTLTTSSSVAYSTSLSASSSSRTSSSSITSTTSQSSSSSSSVRSPSTVSSSSASSSSAASRSSTPGTSSSSSMSSSSLTSTAKTSQSTTSSSTLATSTKSSSLATTSSAKSTSTSSSSTIKPSITSTKTSSSSTIKSSSSSKTSSTSATPTTTSASCPASNGDIFVSNGKRFVIECSTDHNGGDLKSVKASSLAACISSCATTTGCVDVTLSGTTCYLKSTLTASGTSPYNGARLLT